MEDVARNARCPSDLALERYVLHELEPALQRSTQGHVASCGRCRTRLEAMAAEGATYRRSAQHDAASDRFQRADQSWRWKMKLAALVPAVAIALVATPGILRMLQTESPVLTSSDARATVAPVVLEPAAPTAARAVEPLRTVAFAGAPLAVLQGTVQARAESGQGPFTLKHTEVEAEVSGFVSRVTVTQEFENPFSSRVEALYLFPLPENAAVDDMELVVGTRVIRGEIRLREEARRLYEEAKHQGKRAALLDQERPNIFTQSIANIAPGESLKVRLRYVAPLRYDDGVFELGFPMVVGPRFIPGAPLPGASQGSGVSPDTDAVPDGSRISPPVLPPDSRSGRDIAVTVHVDAGNPIEGLTSGSHRLLVERPSAREAVVRLSPEDRVPNKDLIVRFKVAGPTLRSSVLSHKDRGIGTFALLVQPESPEAAPKALPKEMIFVIDTSGSMEGAPLEAAKRAMRRAIETMNPNDTFMLIDFADHASSFEPSPRPNAPQVVARALEYLDALPSAGGTNQLAGLRAALTATKDPERLRTVLLMTDGFIGNDDEVLHEAQKLMGDARLFSFGVGSSVNHHLLSQLAEVGRGFYQYVRPDEDPEPAVERFRRRIARPLVTDVEINWGGLKVSELLPPRIPDLFDNQPLIVLGRYSEGGTAEVVVHGRSGSALRDTAVSVTLPDREERHAALSSMWARKKIEGLEYRRLSGNTDEGLAEQIASLGLEHRLLTAFTSFVAVDQAPFGANGPPEVMISEPLDAPDMAGWRGDRVGSLQQNRTSTIQVIKGAETREAGEVLPPLPTEHDAFVLLVRWAWPRFQKCYESALAKSPDLTGGVTLFLIIGASGRVEEVTVRADPPMWLSPSFDRCLGRAARHLVFSRGPRPRTTDLSLHFPLGAP